MGARLETPVRRVNSCLGKISAKNLGSRNGKRSHKVTPFHELFLTVTSCKVASLFCQGACLEPHAKTPPPPVLSLQLTATQAVELLASVSARTHVLDTDFAVEPTSTPQALNQNPSIV